MRRCTAQAHAMRVHHHVHTGTTELLPTCPPKGAERLSQEQFYFSDSVIVQLRSAIILLRRELAPLLAEAARGGLPVCVVFPDEGAAKRFAPAFADLEQESRRRFPTPQALPLPLSRGVTPEALPSPLSRVFNI